MRKTLTTISILFAVSLARPAAALPTSDCGQEIERGVASWYGPGFENARTTSAEKFDSSLLSAAHPSLPFGTILKVLNMRNSKSVTVRVNDRGAFRKTVIDLSEGAARQLGMIDDGTAAVAIYKCGR